MQGIPCRRCLIPVTVAFPTDTANGVEVLAGVDPDACEALPPAVVDAGAADSPEAWEEAVADPVITAADTLPPLWEAAEDGIESVDRVETMVDPSVVNMVVKTDVMQVVEATYEAQRSLPFPSFVPDKKALEI